jgi:hypothetical protein
LLQQNVLDGAGTYLTRLSVIDYVSGNLRLLAGNSGGIGTNRDANGVYIESLSRDDNDTFKVRADDTFVGSVNEASVKERIEISS